MILLTLDNPYLKSKAKLLVKLRCPETSTLQQASVQFPRGHGTMSTPAPLQPMLQSLGIAEICSLNGCYTIKDHLGPAQDHIFETTSFNFLK